MECPIGTYNSNPDSSSCTECTSGNICVEIGLSLPLDCPDGYICTLNGIFQNIK